MINHVCDRCGLEGSPSEEWFEVLFRTMINRESESFSAEPLPMVCAACMAIVKGNITRHLRGVPLADEKVRLELKELLVEFRATPLCDTSREAGIQLDVWIDKVLRCVRELKREDRP